MTADGESQELEFGPDFVLEAPGALQSGAAGRGEERPQLAAPLSGRPGQCLQAIMQQGQAPEKFCAVAGSRESKAPTRMRFSATG